MRSWRSWQDSGARVHTCSWNEAELEECRRRWAGRHLPVTVSVCDVSSHAEREKLVDAVKQTFHGKLNILVNNAGRVDGKMATRRGTTRQSWRPTWSPAFTSASWHTLSSLVPPLPEEATSSTSPPSEARSATQASLSMASQKEE